MKFRKPTKKEVVLFVILHFMSFALAGLIFGSLAYTMAWSVSIFLVSWMAYWSIKYFIDMSIYMMEMMPSFLIEEPDMNKKRNNKGRNKNRNKK
jgi:hypothetical protein